MKSTHSIMHMVHIQSESGTLLAVETLAAMVIVRIQGESAVLDHRPVFVNEASESTLVPDGGLMGMDYPF